jgi:spermidine synthase
MKPYRNLGEARTPDGKKLSLHEHDGVFFLRLNGEPLMSTNKTTSEVLLAQLGCGHLRGKPKPRVLIGGMGFGFTLKAVLEIVGKGAVVEVSELMAEVIDWNREYLSDVNGKLMDDPRVKMVLEDVNDVLARAARIPEERYDAILLDVDNGPDAFVQEENAQLYGRRGLDRITRALKEKGVVAFWSANQEKAFLKRMSKAGFKSEAFAAKTYDKAKKFTHMIFVGEKGGGAASPL